VGEQCTFGGEVEWICIAIRGKGSVVLLVVKHSVHSVNSVTVTKRYGFTLLR
jgi:hypothetical protein